MSERAATRDGDLAGQQKNLLLIEPIARLEADQRVKSRVLGNLGVDPDRVDLRYVALAMLDNVMEASAFNPGAEATEIVAAGRSQIERMIPEVDEQTALKLARKVYDHLRNAAKRYSAISVEYFDALKSSWSFHEFHYLNLIPDPDDGDRTWIKLGDAGQMVFLGMLEVADELLEEAELIMMRKAIERGRFEDAQGAAARARVRSINYKTFIQDKLYRARRAVGTVDWRADVIPELDGAREHLNRRLTAENELLRRLAEKMAIIKDDADALRASLGLKETIEGCQSIHSALYREVSRANERFVELSANAFEERPAMPCHDPEREVLLPLLKAPLAVSVALSEDFWASLSAPTMPKLLDIGLLFEIATVDRPEDPVEDEEDLIVPLEPLRPRHPPEQFERVGRWFAQQVAQLGKARLSQLLNLAADQGLNESDLRCLVLVAIRSMAAGDDPYDLIVEFGGTYRNRGFIGDDVTFRWRAAA